jgi:hypothetical protein
MHGVEDTTSFQFCVSRPRRKSQCAPRAGDPLRVRPWFRDPGAAETTQLSNAISFVAGP